VRDAKVVLVCVKTVDTAFVARTIAPSLRPGTLVVSLQNGVENVDVLAGAALPARRPRWCTSRWK
jgi:2-dehydropantoate 2-reductase